MKKAGCIAFIILFLLSGCVSNSSEVIAESTNITWWCQNRYSHVGNMSDSAVYSELMNETGVDVLFIHPPQGEHRERFLSMLSEEVLPDIISHDFINDYPGGAEKALNDGVIIPLNDIIDEYCPNLKAYLNDHPEIEEMISTKDGRIFCFPSVQEEREIRTYMGPLIRKDYLDAVGMQAPETVLQWYAVLSAFKDELGITPLSFYGGKIMDTDFLIGAYGLSWDFYIDAGIVKLGPLEDSFSDFIAEFKKWYAEGLISSGVFTDSQKTYTVKAKNGDIGVYIDYVTNIEVYQNTKTDAQFLPITYPVLNAGDTPFSGHIAPVFVPFASCYISKDNKDITATAALLDYAYSKEGSLLFNFGIEGESYEIIDGVPYYTQELLEDTEGFSTAVKRYLASGAYIRDERQFDQMLILDTQKEAVQLWSDTDADEHLMPAIVLSATQAETVAIFNEGYKDIIISWLKDYCMTELSTIDELQTMLYNLGAEEVINIYQEAMNEES